MYGFFFVEEFAHLLYAEVLYIYTHENKLFIYLFPTSRPLTQLFVQDIIQQLFCRRETSPVSFYSFRQQQVWELAAPVSA